MKITFPCFVALALAPPATHAFWRSKCLVNRPMQRSLHRQLTFVVSCGIIQTGRVDPVVSHNAASSHVHKISGASSKFPTSCGYQPSLISIRYKYQFHTRYSDSFLLHIMHHPGGQICLLDPSALLCPCRWHLRRSAKQWNGCLLPRPW